MLREVFSVDPNIDVENIATIKIYEQLGIWITMKDGTIIKYVRRAGT